MYNNVHHRIHNSLPFEPVLNQTNKRNTLLPISVYQRHIASLSSAFPIKISCDVLIADSIAFSVVTVI